MKQRLGIPEQLDGNAWHYRPIPGLLSRHHHEELEFNIVVSGTARYLVDDRRYDFGPDSLVWLFPDQEHILIDTSRDFSMWILVVRPRALKRHCSSQPSRILLEGNPPGIFCRRLIEGDAAHLIRLLTGIAEAEAAEETVRANLGLVHATIEAWHMYARAPDTIASTRLHPAVERVANLLVHPGPKHESSNLIEIAASAGLSHSRLSRLFHQQTGQTLAAYRNRQRLERFFRSTSDRKHTMLSAALKAGFGSYAQFHRIFRAHVGVSPAQWLKQSAAHPQFPSDAEHGP